MPSTCPLVPAALSNFGEDGIRLHDALDGILETAVMLAMLLFDYRAHAQHVDHHDREYLQ